MSDDSQLPPGARQVRPDEYPALLADTAALVDSSHLFKSLDEAGRARLVEAGYVITCPPDTEIIHQGATNATMYVVMSGQVRVQTTNERGALQLAKLGRGGCVGEVSVVTGQPATATVVAETEVQLLAFAEPRIARVVEDYPRVRKLLEAMIVGRARDTVEKIIAE